jgi:hypothetical protein
MRARLLLAGLATVLAGSFLALPSWAVTTPCGAPVVSAGTATVTCDGQVVITYNVNGSANNQEPGNGDNCTGDLNNNSKNWGPSGLPGNACE